jgi:deoxyribodipyrimidine photo-lyase
MIQDERIRVLNDRPVGDRAYVLYWMQASQRAEYNHALEYAVRQANELRQPVVVGLGLTDDYPEANERHYAFMLQGLAELDRTLEERGLRLVVLHESPEQAALKLAKDASLVVADRGYLRFQRQWRSFVAENSPVRVVQVESDVVVPVEVASDKAEYAAYTIRPRLHRHLADYLVPPDETPVQHDSLGLDLEGMDVSDPARTLGQLDLDRSVAPVTDFTGGTAEAKRLLDEFIEHRLDDYDELRNDPSLSWVSHMSPYLHFGQISPVYVALRVAERPGESADAYLEELIVRRELSMNFCHYHPSYDSLDCLPDWAYETLKDHESDAREVTYELAELEAGQTHDQYWNAAQMEMVVTGKMHNYMRMYWGKKILQWVPSLEEAFRIALYLNNRYELDGRDPNSFAGVAWCFGKHDRPWGERDIFGKVRYMSEGGLRRKFDINAYVAKVEGRLAS